ncbi:MAG: radical SAM protein [Candidatus Woesearchaeota archaeon]
MLNKNIIGKIKLMTTKIGPLYEIIREIYYWKEFQLLKKTYYQVKKTGDAPLPEKVVLETTARCNLNCKMCFFNRMAAVKPNELTFEEIKKIFSENDFKSVNLIGGEPMLKQNFFEILEFFDKRGINYDLATNGTLINENNIQKLADCKGLVSVGMSIDGPEELHNQIRGMGNAYQKTINSFKLLNDKGIVNTIVTVIMKENLPYLKHIVDIAHRNKIKFVYFEIERYYISHELKESMRVLNFLQEDLDEIFPLTIVESYDRGYSYKELRYYLRKAQEYGKKKGVKVFFYPKFLMKELEDCYSRELRKNGQYTCRFLNQARIDPYGNVIHCVQMRKSFGNLRDNSFTDIWNSEDYKKFRISFLENNILPICETCLNMVKINDK